MIKKIEAGGFRWTVLDRGTGPVLLLIHGFPLDHTMWAGQIDALSAHFRLLAPDMRGFGGSRWSGEKVTMEQFADDLLALLDALNIQEPIHFCGLSMGGYIAWQFYEKYSERLARLILCDTRAEADTEEVVRGRSMMVGRVLRDGTELVAETMLPKLFCRTTYIDQPNVIEATRQTILRNPRQAVAAAQRGMAERPDATGLLNRIHIPTLVICGANDQITRPDEMRQMAGKISQSQFVEIPDAGHLAPLENPNVFNAALLEFLDES